MPTLTIQIDESMEAIIIDAIQLRKDFRIDGGLVLDREKQVVFLKEIMFRFHEPAVAATRSEALRFAFNVLCSFKSSRDFAEYVEDECRTDEEYDAMLDTIEKMIAESS